MCAKWCGAWWCLALWVVFFGALVPFFGFQSWNPPPFRELHFPSLTPGLSWRNWGQTTYCAAQSYSQPQTEEEIISIIQKASVEKEKVKVVGAGYSFSPIVCSPNDSKINLIQLDRYNHIISMDKSSKQVTVQAGIRMWELNSVLSNVGLALPIAGSLSVQTIGGIVSTAVHSSSRKYGSVSSLVTKLRFIDANGDVCTASPTENSELFYAGGVGVGVMGFISEVTLQCVDQFTVVKEIHHEVAIEQAWKDMWFYLTKYDYVMFVWIPYSELIVPVTLTVDQKGNSASRDKLTVFDYINHWFDYYFSFVIWWIMDLEAALPQSFTPKLHHLIASFNRAKQVSRLPSDFAFSYSEPSRITTDSEYYLPLKECSEAFLQFKREFEEWESVDGYDGRKLKYNSLMFIRFIKHEPFWLSPTYGDTDDQDRCSFDLMLSAQPGVNDLEKLGDKIFLQQLKGRTHWGKNMGGLDATQLVARFPKWTDFLQVRRSVDPDGIFLNEYLEKLFL